MSQAREDYQDKDTALRAPAMTILAVEARRGAAGDRVAEPPAKGEERLSLFWRVFGGTLLSIAALVVVTLYQQFTSSVNELRNDIVRLNEARGDLVKKDELNSRLTPMWNGLNEAKAAGPGVALVREKQALQDQQLKQADEERKALQREVQLLRERVARLEARQGGVKAGPAKADVPD